jgi:putative effector of murein hydrolase LrgA (UPF0299 family)
LFFIPAGVGVIAQVSLIEVQWLPILGGVVGSTLLGLIVTALVMHLTIGSERETPLGIAAAMGGSS